MNKLLLLILLQIASIHAAYAQAIYELVRDKKVKAYIVGSVHKKLFGISDSHFNTIDNVISKSDSLLIETIPSKRPDIIAREKHYALHGITLRELANNENLQCMQSLIRDWHTKWKMPLSYLIDWGPAAFFHTFVQVPVLPTVDSRDANNSLDFHIYKSFLNKYPVIELEGWTGYVDALLRTEPEEYGRVAEAYCKIGTAPGYPGKKHIADMSILVDAVEKGEIDQLRIYYIAMHQQIGWSEKVLYQHFGFRDRRTAQMIHEYLQSGKYKAPLIAVGVAHLGGADGLLNNLRASGYVVKQYQPTAK